MSLFIFSSARLANQAIPSPPNVRRISSSSKILIERSKLRLEALKAFGTAVAFGGVFGGLFGVAIGVHELIANGIFQKLQDPELSFQKRTHLVKTEVIHPLFLNVQQGVWLGVCFPRTLTERVKEMIRKRN